MSKDIDALAFSAEWQAAWNRRDVEAVLAHFHDDVVFTSPVAVRIGFAADGVVRGKAALRRYWNAALERNPALRFQVTTTFAGVNTIVIEFLDQNSVARAEVLVFRSGLVIEGYGTFAA